MKLQIFESIKTGMLDICYIWRKEYVTVFRDFGALIFFFALPFAYPILYALIYNPEVVRDVPMVVVDNARTPLSRELCRNMDASPNAKIVSYCANMDEAKKMMYEKKLLRHYAHSGGFQQKTYARRAKSGYFLLRYEYIT